ncbi:MAG: hypothetical protein E7657_07815 [Ruminococcaceae bacterium]|nr:hypothetical protein [Oscillospiraceae bacterium]
MKDLTQGNVYKTFFFFALPLVFAGFLLQAYNLIDTVIAGRFLGETGLAALGATSELIILTNSTFWGINAGLGIYTASLFGARKYAELKNNLYTTFLILFGSMLFIGILLVIFREPIFDFLRVDDAIRAEATKYFTVYILGFALVVTNDFGLCTLNALGASDFPFKMALLSMTLNISGNLLAVAVLDLGVLGLAISSVTAAFIVDVFYFFKIRRCLGELGVLENTPFRPSLPHLKQSGIYAIPPGFQQLVMYISSFLILPLINSIGDAASAAYIVILQLYSVVAEVYQGSSKTISNYVAQATGAGKTHLYVRGIRAGLLQAVLFALPLVLIFALFPRFFVGLFFPTGFSGEAMDYAILFLTACLPFVLINTVNNLFHSYFRGVADAKLLLITTAFGSFSRLLLTYLLIGRGMTGVFLGWAGSWVLEALLNAALYFLVIRPKCLQKTN